MIESYPQGTDTDRRRLVVAGWLLGIALGGFFDGIVFHQILQWHHVLSLVPGIGGVQRQVFFDGVFHMAMYLVALAALVLLFRGRAALHEGAVGRRLAAAMLLGFGAWNTADVTVNHWLLGLHRARIDVSDPLPWDIGWLVVLGILPIALALVVRRRSAGTGGSGGSSRGGLLATIMSAVLIGSGIWAAVPPAEPEGGLVLFRPGLSQADAFTAIQSAGGLPISNSGLVWAVRLGEDARPLKMYLSGAIFVSSSLLGAGCIGWSRANAAQ